MLDSFKNFLEETKNINWCHWESNVRLEKSSGSKTDLDILVNSEQIEIFKIKLKKYKFFELKSLSWNNYSRFNNWIRDDLNTGKLNIEGIHKIDIDANQEFEDILKITRNEVWECINSKN